MIVGIDEVGRGCWAGPLVAAAVILDRPIKGLKDSKLLSRARRQILAEEIKTSASAWALGSVEPRLVDELGLTEATKMAMEQALSRLTSSYDEIIIDGNYNYLGSFPKARAIIKADATIAAVSAASILAKVARDEYMIEAAKKFPLYQFDKHVGYGTKLHLQLLKQYGACELHRFSYKPLRVLGSLHV